MCIEYILITLLFFAAYFGSRRLLAEGELGSDNQLEFDHAPVEEVDDLRYYRNALAVAEDLRKSRALSLSAASANLQEVKIWRGFAEFTIHCIERALADNFCGVATSISLSDDAAVLSLALESYEESYIRSRQSLHVHIEEARLYSNDLLSHAKQLGEWVQRKAPYIHQMASSHIGRLGKEAREVRDATVKMLEEGNRDPAFTSAEFLSPQVIEFREKLVALRSKISSDIAA
ncbi:MAG: hypothetical protein K2Y39_14550 [Candidatus Obscuribacterales bacterium]|nr:hypothetical protein [Candidatus Obscuribacterales bacterium]